MITLRSLLALHYSDGAEAANLLAGNQGVLLPHHVIDVFMDSMKLTTRSSLTEGTKRLIDSFN